MTQHTDTFVRELANGPSRESLFDALKYAHDEKHPHVVEFTTDDGRRLTIRVEGLIHRNNAGKNFILVGSVCGGSGAFRDLYVRGWFHVGTRRGRVEFSNEWLSLDIRPAESNVKRL